jgi:hypothetical protein
LRGRCFAMRGPERHSAISHGYCRHDLLSAEEVAGVMAEANAEGSTIDLFDVTEVWFDAEGRCVASFTFDASGDQRADAPRAGTTVTGTAKLRADGDGSTEFVDITAEADFGDEGYGEDDEATFGDEG